MAHNIKLSDKVQLWPIEKLVPYTKQNARVHPKEQVEQIAASITEFGFTAPILVDEKSGILAGHGRLAAAKQLKLAKVPVIQLKHLNEIQRRAYMLADNKIPLSAQWNAKKLNAELAALSKKGYDIGLVGFTEDDIARLTDDLDELALRSHSNGGGGGGGGGGSRRASDDDDGEDEGSINSGLANSVPGEYVNLNFVVTPKQRDFILEAITFAKAQLSIAKSGDAIHKICKQWKEQYDA